jgi:hypothetical protein
MGDLPYRRGEPLEIPIGRPVSVKLPRKPDEDTDGPTHRFQLLDDTYLPCAGTPYELELPSGSVQHGTTDPDGHLEHDLPHDADSVKIRYKPRPRGPKVELTVQLSTADPDSDEYLVAQLKNAGFAAEGDPDAVAIRRFQAAAGLPPSGTLDDATKRALERVIEGGPRALRGVIFEDGEAADAG